MRQFNLGEHDTVYARVEEPPTASEADIHRPVNDQAGARIVFRPFSRSRPAGLHISGSEGFTTGGEPEKLSQAPQHFLHKFAQAISIKVCRSFSTSCVCH
jgi:hypothetical protein